MWRLVIVDDEYYTIEGMKRIIDWDKYNICIVGTAMDGLKGLEVVRRKGADILIVDICMQEMDGLEMIAELRKSGYKGKIIILSGYQRFEYARSAIDFKVDKYLTKPVNPEAMEEIIAKLTEELEQENGGKITDDLPEFFRCVIEEVDGHFTENISLSGLAEKFYCSVTHLSKMFKQYIGMNFIEYITNKRIERAKTLLIRKDMSIDEVMAAVGWQDIKHFRSVFKKYEGISPSEYRRRNMK